MKNHQLKLVWKTHKDKDNDNNNTTLHPRDVDRLRVLRKEGGRGLDSIDASIQWLKDYIEKYKGSLITTTRNNTDNMSINRTKITSKQKWEEKQLYGHFKWQTSDISHEKTWT